jgi:hypothetical protein
LYYYAAPIDSLEEQQQPPRQSCGGGVVRTPDPTHVEAQVSYYPEGSVLVCDCDLMVLA